MHVFITGISGGLGLALAHEFLAKGAIVTGIGRTNSINHPNYSFLNCDLSDLTQVVCLDLGKIDQDAILINNAGIIGNIQRLSDQEHPDVEAVMNINALAPMLLSAKFMRSTSSDIAATIVNISSGAARRAIPSWASYCASKAAIDRFSETFYFEEKEKGRKIRVYAVAPGVIDTNMQTTIRTTNAVDFSSIERFKDLKSTNSLKSPQATAAEIYQLVTQAKFDESAIICSL